MASARRAGALVASALLAGCATTARDFRENRLEGFGEAYRAARVVTIVAPYAEAREHFRSFGDVLRTDWSASGFENLADALRSEIESRGLEVVWVEETRDNAAQVQAIREAFGRIVAWHGGLTEFQEHRFEPELRSPLGKEMGALLREEGGDLLLVAQASSLLVETAQPTGADVAMDVFLRIFLGVEKEEDPASTGAWIRLAVADREGRVVYLGGWNAGGATLQSPDAVSRMVQGALEGFPVEDGSRRFGEVCVLDGECAVGLFCPYGRCLKGERPPVDPAAAAAQAAAEAARRESARVARAERTERARLHRIEARGDTAPQWQAYWKCVELRGAAATFYCQDEMMALQAACDAAGGHPTWEDCLGEPP